MATKKPFLPGPEYKPLAWSFFAFLCAALSFVLVGLGFYLESDSVVLFGFVFFLISFLNALGGFVVFGWRMLVKGHWRKDERRRWATYRQAKQPCE